MSSYKDVLVQINIGQVMPTQAYQTLLDKFQPNVMGFASAVKGEILSQGDGKIMDAKEFDEFQTGFIDDCLLINLGSYPRGFDPTDAQPYILASEDVEVEGETVEQPFLVAMMDGDFSNISGAKNPRADANSMIEKIIGPIMEAFQDKKPEATIDDLLAHFDDPSVKKKVEEACVRGVVKILGNTGEIKTFSKNELGGKFEWGEMSQTFGYGEKEFPSKEEKPVAKHKRWFKTRDDASKEPEKAPVQVPDKPKDDITKVGDTTIIHKQPDPPKTETAALAADMVWARPKIGLNKNERKTWYNKRHQNQLPKGWNAGQNGSDAPYILVQKDNLGTNSELKNAETAISAALTKAKDTDTHHVGKTTDVIEPKLPIVPDAQLKAFESTFMNSSDAKKVTSGVHGLPTMADLEADEKKFPTWYDKSKMHLEQTLHWPDAMEMALLRDYPHLALLKIKALKAQVIKNLHEHGSAHTTKEEPEAEVVAEAVKPKLKLKLKTKAA